MPFELWASPEPTVARIDATTYRDQLADTGHQVRDGDLELLATVGVTATRYPVLWEKTAPERDDDLQLAWAARRLERLRALGIEPLLTLLHHGSGPPTTHLLDPEFSERFARYAGAVAAAFPWVRRWTPINEPLTTARFAALYGYWFPNLRSDAAFGQAIVNQTLAIQLAMRAIRERVPQAELMITEDLQSFRALDPGVAGYVAHKRERMYLSLELAMGRVVPGHPLHAYLAERCGLGPAPLARVAALATAPALVGWNYYPNSERVLGRGADGALENRAAQGRFPLSALPLLRAAHRRLGLPFGLSEVHCSGDERQRLAWLRARREELEALVREGLPVRMLGAWAAFGSVDWDSLLRERADAREDGVFTFAAPGERPQATAVARELMRLARA